jgi:hypothetical protein
MSLSALKKLGIKPDSSSPSKGDFYYQKLLDEELKKETPDWKQVKQFIGFQVVPSLADADTGMNVLHKASLHGQTEITKWAIGFTKPTVQAGIQQDAVLNINGSNKYGRTALHFACDSGHADIVTLLLENKADVNAMSLGGLTALHVASRQTRVACVKALLGGEQEVDVYAETSDRQMASMLTKDGDILKLIQEYGH